MKASPLLGKPSNPNEDIANSNKLLMLVKIDAIQNLFHSNKHLSQSSSQKKHACVQISNVSLSIED